MITNNWKEALLSGGTLLCELALKVLEARIRKTTYKQNDTEINEILFYGAEDEEKTKQVGLDNLLCIYYLILHAGRSIDVCVPSLVSESTAKCLINVQQKNNVRIRITIHNSDNFHNLQLLAKNGIEVKIINPNVKLQHEFILIDASGPFADAIAIIGSLDYDTDRVNCSKDTTLISSEYTLITGLKKEFDRVWNSVADIPHENDDKM